MNWEPVVMAEIYRAYTRGMSMEDIAHQMVMKGLIGLTSEEVERVVDECQILLEVW